MLRGVFFATFLCTATALLIAPSDHHRVLWRQGAREERLELGNVLTILGLVFLVPAMVAVIFVISDIVFGGTVAVVLAGSFAGLWFGVPLLHRSGAH